MTTCAVPFFFISSSFSCKGYVGLPDVQSAAQVCIPTGTLCRMGPASTHPQPPVGIPMPQQQTSASLHALFPFFVCVCEPAARTQRLRLGLWPDAQEQGVQCTRVMVNK